MSKTTLASTLRKIAWARQGYFVLITIVLVLIPLYVKMSLPVPVTESVQKEYEFLQTIKAGDYALFIGACNAMDWPMYGSVYVGVLNEVLRHGGRAIVYGGDAIVLADWANLQKNTPKAAELAATPGRGYGVDWIILAFHPGDEASLNLLLSNLWIGERDALYGKSYSEYPIMRDLKTRTGTDFKLVHVFGPGFTANFRIYVDKWGIGYLGTYSGDTKVEASQYVALGRMKGAVMGMADTAGLETLTGIVGPGLISSNTMNLYGLLALGCILISNLLMIASRSPRESVKKGGSA